MENQKRILNSKLQITPSSSNSYLAEMGKWAKFSSVSFIVFSGIFLIIVLLSSSGIKVLQYLSNFFGGISSHSVGVMTAIVIIEIGFFFIFGYFLYNFSTKIQLAIQTKDKTLFNVAISSLKTFFILSAIFSAIGLLNTIFSLIKL